MSTQLLASVAFADATYKYFRARQYLSVIVIQNTGELLVKFSQNNVLKFFVNHISFMLSWLAVVL